MEQLTKTKLRQTKKEDLVKLTYQMQSDLIKKDKELNKMLSDTPKLLSKNDKLKSDNSDLYLSNASLRDSINKKDLVIKSLGKAINTFVFFPWYKRVIIALSSRETIKNLLS